MYKILVMDNDHELVEYLSNLLREEGFYAIPYPINRDSFPFENYDLLLIDIYNQKQMNGLEILKKIRSQTTLPIIIISNKNSELDKVLALELGADDYMLKPLYERELIARIKAILRRTQLTSHSSISTISPYINFDGLILNPAQHKITYQEKPIPLTNTEFEILLFLIQNHQQIISRETLCERILNKPLTAFDRSIDVHISNLRKKLPIRVDGLPWIKTLKNRGYLMVSKET